MHRSVIIGGVALLVAGVATAAYTVTRGEYAEVVRSEPITELRPASGDVIAKRERIGTKQEPREVCTDRVVEGRLPERDGNVGGTVAGAVIGGLIGNQVGSGSGRDAATVAGAVAGGFAGREVDRRHVGGQRTTRTQRSCSTVYDTREGLIGYDIEYRLPDGKTGTLQTEKDPGSVVDLGQRETVVGYAVTYRYGNAERSVRMDRDPGTRLPVVDGAVVIATDRDVASR